MGTNAGRQGNSGRRGPDAETLATAARCEEDRDPLGVGPVVEDDWIAEVGSMTIAVGFIA